jgi:chromosomal replication initiation ATPase DnaA
VEIIAIDEKHKKVDIGVPNEFISSQIKKFFAKTLKAAVQSVYNQQFSYELHIYTPFQSKIANPLQIDIKKLLKMSDTVNVQSENKTTQTSTR